MGVVRQGQGQLIRTVDRSRAVDLARAAAAEIAAGISTPDELDGVVTAETDDPFGDARPEPTGWELQIDTERAGLAGLTLVTITALRSEDAASPGGPRHTTRVLVTLESDAAPNELEANELEEALDDLDRPGRFER
jgi:hypothetical protein